MTLRSGAKLGTYEIIELLGVGGMGKVYRARDSRLKREVAIKVLPEGLSDDAHPRFQREAEVLASLNHPFIAAIYDVADFGASRFLVLELVEGDTLADRIARGPIPLGEALAIARQVAEALEAAHAKGITHRDLKPANIKITPDGNVKVLDFGLAKLTEQAGGEESTLTHLQTPPTEAGTVLGTPAYMSPEQARGKRLDKRTDIWSFGCVLYEMLTGRKMFASDTISDAIAAVLTREPDWSALPPDTPPTIRRLLQRCLRREAKLRLHDIADARLEIDEASLEPPAPAVGAAPVEGAPRWRITPRVAGVLAAAAVLLLLLGAVAGVRWWPARETASKSPLARLMITLPSGLAIEKGRFPPVALSPDGKLLAYAASADGGRTNLYLRPLDELAAHIIPATEGAIAPFFSPDGRWLAFYVNGQLKKVSVAGGVPLTICEAPPLWSASWGADDNIVFATTLAASGLWRVSAHGGEAAPLTTPKAGEAQHGYPQLLPGGTQVLFSVRRGNAWQLALLSLKSREWRLLGNGRVIGEGAQYLPTGHLVYEQSGGLVATPFDPSTGDLNQPPVPLTERLETSRFGGTYFAFAASAGTLVYVPAGAAVADRTLLRIDREGRVAPLIEARGGYEYPALSPDGRKVAVMITTAAGSDIWIIDLERSTRLRFTAGGSSAFPVWAPDGSRMAFQSTAPGPWNLFWRPLDGSAESQPLLKAADSAPAPSWPNTGASLLPGTLPTLSGAGPQFPVSWAPDGSALAFHERKPDGERDIWVAPPGGDPVPFLLTPFDERLPRFSPDGKWLAYVSDESGRNDVYVQPYPGPGPKWLVSTDGGMDPVWSRDGREMFYRQGDQMMAVAVTARAEFSAGRPHRLFQIRFDAGDNGPNFDVSPDGKWFVMARSDQGQPPGELHLVLNWFNELAVRAPVASAPRLKTPAPQLAAFWRLGP